MREILFRGKRVDNGEWETGSLLVERMNTSEQKVMIADKMTGYPTLVFPETVGQYTGLKDKNGKKVFEWDILSIKCADQKSRPYPVYFGTYNVDGYGNDFHIGFYTKYFDEDISLGFLADSNVKTDFEVIGNIFDKGKSSRRVEQEV